MLNNFHIIIETASNLNKTIIHFLLFFWIRDIWNFKSTRLKVNSLTCQKERFLHWKPFQTEFFFREWGGKRVRACAGPAGPAPRFSEKNSFWNDFQCKKRSFLTSQGIYFESSWFEIPNVSNSAKKQKMNFGFLQFGSSFNYNMKII